jgi:UDP-GlcNAc:undecaprenyl-phosphate GlcNAc-1-phosphate transferase
MTDVPVPALYALAFLLPLVATWLLTPVAAAVARRLGIFDHPGPTKFHVEATPYLGGLAVAAGLAVAGGVAAGASGQLLVIMLGGLALGITGLLDDGWTVRPSVKLLVEGSAGVALWLVGVRAGLFGVAGLDLLLTVFWVIAVTNVINMLDNMDGLASGVTAIAAGTFFLVSAGQGEYLVGSFALAVAGASLGFLRHNFPPARIFLGDAGTLMLGFLLAALGLKLDLVGPNGLIRAAVPVLVLGVPIFDAALVIVARFREGRPVYRGGKDHSSHRLVAAGLSPRSVALVTYGAQIGTSALALWLLGASGAASLVVLAGLAVASLGGLFLLLSLPTVAREALVAQPLPVVTGNGGLSAPTDGPDTSNGPPAINRRGKVIPLPRPVESPESWSDPH